MERIARDKEDFFKGLEQLDCWTEDSEEDFERIIALSRQKDRSTRAGTSSSTTVLLSHSHLATVHSSNVASLETGRAASLGTEEKSHVYSNLEADRPKAMGEKSSTGCPVAGAPKGKRKRAPSCKTIPDQQQIFKGLVFFFFPNSDVSPLRRFRIQRAQEYGAQWAKAWGGNVTHVIVDKGLTFQEILKHLSLETIPSAIALVDESYPAECIKFRSVLSTTHVRFHVNGAPTSSENKQPSPTAGSTCESLLLKPEHRQEKRAQSPYLILDSQDDFPVKIFGPQVERSKNVPDGTVGGSLPARERDILDDMIEAAKAVNHLPLEPLDAPDDDAAVGASDSEASETSDSGLTRQKKRRKDNETVESWQQKFACMQKHDSSPNSNNPNSRTVEVLQQMLDYYTRTSDHWRMLAYRKAISALRKQPKKVITRNQALSIPGIGSRLADKIEEIVFTNRLRRLENTNSTAEDRLLQEFLGVYGAGVSHASRWVTQGYKSLEDLKTKASLTTSQRIGVERHYDFSQRISRSEVEAHGNIVRRTVQNVNPGMQVIIGGSYRRGAVDSGDIDLIITKPDAAIEEIRTMMIDIVVPQLFRLGFLQASLASTSRGDGSKWHGASKLPDGQLWRRIDLLFVPGAEIGAALIYFTGNDIFNRSMRLLASKKSMRLNQRGLYSDVLRGPQRTKLNPGRLVESRDERRIFEILGVPWRPPEHRIC